jgi:hypothetical protein
VVHASSDEHWSRRAIANKSAILFLIRPQDVLHYELYDMRVDEFQLHNIYSDASPAMLAELHASVLRMSVEILFYFLQCLTSKEQHMIPAFFQHTIDAPAPRIKLDAQIRSDQIRSDVCDMQTLFSD